MTATQRAIASLYYRLVYEKHVITLDDVPMIYRGILAEYCREVERKS